MHTLQAGKVSGPYCGTFVLLATLCTDMPSMAACKGYKALCAPSTGSVVKQCAQQAPIPRWVLEKREARREHLPHCWL